jgi:putative copper resistance protein D
MAVISVARAIGLLSASFILGAMIVAWLVGSSEEAVARDWRRRLARAGGLLAVPFGVSGLVVIFSGGPVGGGLALVAHVAATALWVGPLLSLVFLPRAEAPGRTDLARGAVARSARSVTALALAFAGVAAASVVLLGWTVPGGPPALAGTRYGRLLLVQAILVGAALVPVVVMKGSLLRTGQGPIRVASAVPRLGVLVPACLLGVASTAVAATLVGVPASRPEPIVWPFAYRFAPVLVWSAPGQRTRAIIGFEVLLAGLLALVAAIRFARWRPLLIAAGFLLSAGGAYQALISLSIDAYPTTYARPTVPDSPASVHRGRELFLANCAVCHGADGRGDGPAASSLLQRPADLTSPHTADHTPGDLFWWVTYGLGLAMPAFGDRLSVDDRWDVVHFVRTLPKPLPPRASGRILGAAS